MSADAVRIGGLMRCCTGTLSDERTADKTPAEEGDVLPCNWCSSSMIFRAGAWEWNHPPLSSEPTGKETR